MFEAHAINQRKVNAKSDVYNTKVRIVSGIHKIDSNNYFIMFVDGRDLFGDRELYKR